MKIEQSEVVKIKVLEVYGLDPVHIYLEDYEPRKGKITISCYDKSWHSYWGGMGDRTIREFFLSCDNGYLAKNLSSTRARIDDYEALKEKIKSHHGDDMDYFIESEIDSLDEDWEWKGWLQGNQDVMQEIFGEEWWYDIPQKDNHEYIYLCKIIDTVKEALKEVSR